MISFVSIGDLARNIETRIENARLKTEMQRLSTEVSTGLVADVPARLSGDLAPLAGIERDLARLDAWRDVRTAAEGLTDTAQTGLDRVRAAVADLAVPLAGLEPGSLPAEIALRSEDAATRFADAVGALASVHAGRAVFGGKATDGPPIAPAGEILDAIRAAAAPATDAAGVVAAVDAFFAPGGAFETTYYAGADDPLEPVAIGADRSVAPPPTADAPPLRDALAGLALGALVGAGPLADPAERDTLAQAAADRLLGAETGVLALSAELGLSQQAIERQAGVDAGRRAALETARADLLSVDPFESATALQDVQTRLETLYAVTARTARLSLVDYLR